MTKDPYIYLENLREIFDEDIRELNIKDRKYASSWKKRGGVGAYFTMIRKLDAMENIVDMYNYNIFRAVAMTGKGDGTALDQIRDLRRYLALVEAELMQRAKDGDGNFTAIFGDPRSEAKPQPGAIQWLPEGQKMQSGAALGQAIQQANPPPTLPEGISFQPPLICDKVAMTYEDVYDMCIPFNGSGLYRTLKTVLPGDVWKKLPNEFKKHYNMPPYDSHAQTLGDAVMNIESLAEIKKFSQTFLPGGSNYSSS